MGLAPVLRLMPASWRSRELRPSQATTKSAARRRPSPNTTPLMRPACLSSCLAVVGARSSRRLVARAWCSTPSRKAGWLTKVQGLWGSPPKGSAAVNSSRPFTTNLQPARGLWGSASSCGSRAICSRAARPEGIRASPRKVRPWLGLLSTSVTPMPARLSSRARVAPAGPAPTITTLDAGAPIGPWAALHEGVVVTGVAAGGGGGLAH